MRVIYGSMILLMIIITVLLIIALIDTIKNDKGSKKNRIINISAMIVSIILDIYSLIIITLEFKNL